MKILVINCGSSSLKYQLFDMESEKWLAKGICEAIGTSTSSAKGSTADGREFKKPDVNIDYDGDKKPDINVDTNKDGKISAQDFAKIKSHILGASKLQQ